MQPPPLFPGVKGEVVYLIREAIIALVLMDHYLRHRAQNGDVTPPLKAIPGACS